MAILCIYLGSRALQEGAGGRGGRRAQLFDDWLARRGQDADTCPCVSLAHRGVLFLDELPEFGPRNLDTPRQPKEDLVDGSRLAITMTSRACTPCARRKYVPVSWLEQATRPPLVNGTIRMRDFCELL